MSPSISVSIWTTRSDSTTQSVQSSPLNEPARESRCCWPRGRKSLKIPKKSNRWWITSSKASLFIVIGKDTRFFFFTLVKLSWAANIWLPKLSALNKCIRQIKAHTLTPNKVTVDTLEKYMIHMWIERNVRILNIYPNYITPKGILSQNLYTINSCTISQQISF